jgi:hypothetical protein
MKSERTKTMKKNEFVSVRVRVFACVCALVKGWIDGLITSIASKKKKKGKNVFYYFYLPPYQPKYDIAYGKPSIPVPIIVTIE